MKLGRLDGAIIEALRKSNVDRQSDNALTKRRYEMKLLTPFRSSNRVSESAICFTSLQRGTKGSGDLL